MSARWSLHHGDCLAWLRTIPSASVDSIVTDPPAGIAFMGKHWDHHKGGRSEWVAWLASVMAECLRVLKPGGHALVWSLPRTEHWTACAVEDAGFEIRDGVYHLCSQGWPKSLDVSKAIDEAAGEVREVVGRKVYANEQGRNSTVSVGYNSSDPARDTRAVTAPATDDAKRWQGFGSALKPSVERWILARKPLDGTIATNVLAHGVGALNIDGCRVESGASPSVARRETASRTGAARTNDAGGIVDRTTIERFTEQRAGEALGRWPSNVVLSHTEHCADECHEACPVRELDRQSGTLKSGSRAAGVRKGAGYSRSAKGDGGPAIDGDEGGASRFFPAFHPFGYFAKAKSASQRGGRENKHPTVKNVDLMRWLVRLITPRGGLVLDAFGGSGTTGVAALLEGNRFMAAEADADSYETARKRLEAAERGELTIRECAPAPSNDDAEQPSLFAGAK